MPVALAASALRGTGIAEVWETLQQNRATLTATGELAVRREQQNVSWMWDELNERVLSVFRTDPAVATALKTAEERVRDGRQPPGEAADELLHRWRIPTSN